MPFPLRFRELPPGQAQEVGPAKVSSFATQHTLESHPHGYDIRCGDHRVVYSGDTGWFDELPRVGRGSRSLHLRVHLPRQRISTSTSITNFCASRSEQFDCGGIILTHLGSGNGRTGAVPRRIRHRRRRTDGTPLGKSASRRLGRVNEPSTRGPAAPDLAGRWFGIPSSALRPIREKAIASAASPPERPRWRGVRRLRGAKALAQGTPRRAGFDGAAARRASTRSTGPALEPAVFAACFTAVQVKATRVATQVLDPHDPAASSRRPTRLRRVASVALAAGRLRGGGTPSRKSIVQEALEKSPRGSTLRPASTPSAVAIHLLAALR